MFCITYDTTCYADLQRAFDSFMRQLQELFGPRAPCQEKQADRLTPAAAQGWRGTTRRICGPIRTRICRGIGCRDITLSPEIPPEGSCSRADEAQDDSDTDNTDEGDHLCLTG